MKNRLTLRPDHSAASLRRAATQRGSFLLEALVSVLIVALGILGLVGLQARAIQNVDDAQYRSEAAFLANDAVGQMWTSQSRRRGHGRFRTTRRSGAPVHRIQDDGRRATARRAARPTNPEVTVTPRAAAPWATTSDHRLLAAALRDLAPYYETAATVRLNS